MCHGYQLPLRTSTFLHHFHCMHSHHDRRDEIQYDGHDWEAVARLPPAARSVGDRKKFQERVGLDVELELQINTLELELLWADPSWQQSQYFHRINTVHVPV